ncbi:MAG: amidohydrolase [Bacillota bacterium]
MKLFFNANIITSASSEKYVEAFVVNRGKILEVGKSDLLKKNYPQAKFVDLNGKTVIPGLNDSHLHLFQYGISKRKIDLSATNSIKEIQNKIKNYIKNNDLKENEWIEAKGWNDENLKEKRFPTLKDLDQITKKYPIIAKRACFHVASVNSKALHLAKIDNNISDPEGGEIAKNSNGELNGLLYDEAIDLIEEKIPQKSVSEIKEILKESFQDLLATGLTSAQVDDFFNVENPEKILKAYLELKEEGKIPLRINLQMRIPSKEKIKEFNERGIITGYGDENFKIGAVKLVLDGSLGARTAALKKEYNDKKSITGKKLYKQEKFNEICKFAKKRGFQLAVHAIGDKAIEMALNGFEYTYENAKEAKKHRPIIVHAQVSNKKLNDKMKKLGIIAAIQPVFLRSDWDIIENRLGKKRAKLSYAWKSYYNQGIHLSGSSDAPIEPFNPFFGLYTAVSRQDFDGNPENGWHPEEKLTINQALEIFTKGSAHQSFEENIKGELSKGKFADFLIINKDIRNIESSEIKDIEVLKTYVGGKAVYKK